MDAAASEFTLVLDRELSWLGARGYDHGFGIVIILFGLNIFLCAFQPDFIDLLHVINPGSEVDGLPAHISRQVNAADSTINTGIICHLIGGGYLSPGMSDSSTTVKSLLLAV